MESLKLTLERFAGNAMELAVMLVPLAVYLLLLGMGVNRARRPTAVAGPWSFAMLLLGLSGFLLLGPPSWIAHLFRTRGESAYWGAYAAFVLGLFFISYSLCARQRQTLVIYNIEPEQFAAVIEKVLDELKLPYTHTPGRISFKGGQLLLDIETSALWHNATLRWRGEAEGVREPVESGVRQALKSVETGSNPASLLLTLLAVVIIAYLMLATALFVLLVR